MTPVAYPNKEGFFRIPNFSRYCIDENGIVIDTKRNDRIIPVSKSSSGYLSCMLYSDDRKYSGMFIHRLLLLTFKYPEGKDLRSLVVDHKDGDRMNNSLENLEWVDRSENCKRAGFLRTSSRSVPIVLTDMKTKEERVFDTITECAKFLNLHKDGVRKRLEKGPDVVFPEGYSIRRLYPTENNMPVPNRRETMPSNGHGKQLIIRNLFTHEEQEFSTMTATAKFLGMSLSAFSHAINPMKHPVLPGGYQIKFTLDIRPWRDCKYWEEIQQLCPRCPVIERLNVSTNELERYESIKIASQECGLSPYTVRERAKTQGEIDFNGYRWATFPNLSNNHCPNMKKFVLENLSNCGEPLRDQLATTQG